MVDPHFIDIVDVGSLHERLRFSTPLQYPSSSRRKPFSEWKMEVDDSPILRYLYRHLSPLRHLEFGTWEGTGACYCLEESAATIWTINLPDGEFIHGKPAYTHASTVKGGTGGQGLNQTDAGTFIGHRYRQAGFGHRVCQIYCDSREWDTSTYPPAFFDSVLVDGGHSEDVVVSDTRKAVALLRSGGLIMWHDFCPDPEIFEVFPSVLGVIQALTKNWQEFAPALNDVFWVRPSFILIGVRR
jgi:hypothetical protein